MKVLYRPLAVAALAFLLFVVAPTASATSGTLVITSNTTLTEDHFGNVVFAADNVTLDCNGHTIHGPGVAGPSGGIDTAGSDGVSVKNCTVSEFQANGIYSPPIAGGSSNLTLDHNTLVSNGAHGIHVDLSVGTVIRDNTTRQNQDIGIVVTRSQGARLERNTALASAPGGWEVGFALLDGTTGSVLVGNTANGHPAAGFLVQGSNGNALRRNSATGNGNGFAVLASLNTTLVGNLAARNLGPGIAEGERNGFMIYNSPYTALTDNVANENADGFELIGSSNSSVRENEAHSNRLSGFYFGDMWENSIIGNEAVRNEWGLFIDNASSGSVVENEAILSRAEGFMIVDGSSGNVIEGNRATKSGLSGFFLRGARNNTLNGNVAVQSGAEGFALDGVEVTGNTLTKNRAMRNHVGFSARPGAGGNTLTRNVALTNSVWDAEDFNPPGSNVWQQNRFGTTRGI